MLYSCPIAPDPVIEWPVVPTRSSASKPPLWSSHSALIMPTCQQLGDATGGGGPRLLIRRLLVAAQGNRVKNLPCDQVGEEVVIPARSLALEPQ